MTTPKTDAWPQVWSDHDKKVKPYVWSHRLLSWARLVMGMAFLVIGFKNKIFWGLQLQLEAWRPQSLLSWVSYFLIVGAVWEVIAFPVSWASYRVERSFGLSKQMIGAWFVDQMKGWAVGGVLGAIVLSALYFIVHWFGAYWWLAAATFLVAFSILLAQLAPVVFIPLFFKLKPMPASELKERLLALCRKFKIEVKEIYHMGMGEKTEKGNAAFTGLGRTKRILIGDTLYEKFPPDQVEAVFAHELGHQVHNDLWKGIFFSTFWIYLGFFASNYVFGDVEEDITRPMSMLIFFLIFTIVQMPVGVLQAIYSRSREHAADRFAAETTKLAAPLADSLERLTLQNWGLFKPNALLEYLTFSHPAPWRRIRYLRKAQ